MYEVYWDKLLFRKPRRKCSDDFLKINLNEEDINLKDFH